MKQIDLLETVDWAEGHFGSLFTGGNVSLRDMRRAEARGLVRSVGLVEQCDGDGTLLPEKRQREGWVLTESGKSAIGLVGASGRAPAGGPTP